ncbi:hypothetical protein ES702_03113 [subsurface metagenome]
MIGFCDHEFALTLPTNIDAEGSLRSITSVMKPQQDADDDDLVLVDDSMTISIADPFSARVFTIPVRGRNCKHRECFDLETFLSSRQSDYKDALTSVYAWQCPICSGDARPCSLVIDEFFRRVRDKVFELGQEEEARAIVVKADGTWELKQDPGENNAADKRSSRQRSQGSEVPSATSVAKLMDRDDKGAVSSTNGQLQNGVNSGSRTMEVIELD